MQQNTATLYYTYVALAVEILAYPLPNKSRSLVLTIIFICVNIVLNETNKKKKSKITGKYLRN